jgi:glycosyltransferase involved in cell wall biosynthesis
VSASKDEGFGIPLVEAMGHGCPIVVSEIPIFKEVAAEAGNYFNPDIPQDFANSIQALRDAQQWQNASTRSRQRGSAFSWDKSAADLLKVLKEL